MLKISFVDICDPSFLTDHHNREGEQLISIDISDTSTINEVRDELITEIDKIDDLPEEYGMRDIREEAEVYFRQFARQIDARNGHSLFAPNVEYPKGEDVEPLQAWFLIKWGEAAKPETKEEEGARLLEKIFALYDAASVANIAAAHKSFTRLFPALTFRGHGAVTTSFHVMRVGTSDSLMMIYLNEYRERVRNPDRMRLAFALLETLNSELAKHGKS